MTPSSDDDDPLGRIDCFDDCHNDTKDTSHVDPVTLTGSRYRYTSQLLDPILHIDLEHRPEKVHQDNTQPGNFRLSGNECSACHLHGTHSQDRWASLVPWCRG